MWWQHSIGHATLKVSYWVDYNEITDIYFHWEHVCGFCNSWVHYSKQFLSLKLQNCTADGPPCPTAHVERLCFEIDKSFRETKLQLLLSPCVLLAKDTLLVCICYVLFITTVLLSLCWYVVFCLPQLCYCLPAGLALAVFIKEVPVCWYSLTWCMSDR